MLPTHAHAQDSSEAARLQVLATAGVQCGVTRGVQFYGPDVIRGENHKADDAAECCAACNAHRGAVSRGAGGPNGTAGAPCNLWAYCFDRAACKDAFQQCWLRSDQALPAPPAQPRGAVKMPGWVSGAVYPPAAELAALANANTLQLATPQGTLTIELLVRGRQRTHVGAPAAAVVVPQLLTRLRRICLPAAQPGTRLGA